MATLMDALLDYVEHDVINESLDTAQYIPDTPLLRTSVDNVSNNHGLLLLDLCKSTSFRIANGRIDSGNNYTYTVSVEQDQVL